MYDLFEKLFNALLMRLLYWLIKVPCKGHLSGLLSCPATAQGQRVGKGSLDGAGGSLPRGRREGLKSVSGTEESEGRGSSGNFPAASSL